MGGQNPKEDARQCQIQCKRNPNCSFWTFDREFEWCYLKTSKEKVFENIEDEKKYISGDQNCKVPIKLASWGK